MADANNYDWSSVEEQLKNQLGDLYTPGALESVKANASYGSGDQVDPNAVQDWTNRIAAKESLRASNEPNSTYVPNGEGGYTVGPTGKINGSSGGGSSSVSSQWNSQGLDYQNQLIKQLMDQQAAAAAENKARGDQLYNTYLGRSQQALNINRNDPVIRAQADAYAANQERAARNYLNDLAEKSGPYANLQGQQRLVAEQTGQATGAFEAQLLGRELQARRDEIAQALAGQAGLLTADQQRTLQSQLALLDQAIKQQGIGIQQQGLGLQAQGLSQDWQKALLQNEQFMNNLGLGYANLYSNNYNNYGNYGG